MKADWPIDKEFACLQDTFAKLHATRKFLLERQGQKVLIMSSFTIDGFKAKFNPLPFISIDRMIPSSDSSRKGKIVSAELEYFMQN